MIFVMKQFHNSFIVFFPSVVYHHHINFCGTSALLERNFRSQKLMQSKNIAVPHLFVH